MKIRKSTEQDFKRIMEIYAFAREYMKTHGNPNQWEATVLIDIFRTVKHI